MDLHKLTIKERTYGITKKSSRLIESILLRIPLPAFYFSKDEKGKYQVVDGQQRLTAIYDYMLEDIHRQIFT